MSYKTWQEYWIQTGYGQTVGKIGGGSLVKGTLDTAHRFNPSSTERRYKLPGNAAPVWNEAGNVDPSVLEEWAADHDVKIETPAGATEQQDLKYVADGNGKTWYEAVLRPWTIAREAGGGSEEGLSVTLGELGSIVREELEAVEDGLRKEMRELEARSLSRDTSIARQLVVGERQMTDLQAAQHKAVMDELKQVKQILQRLAPGKAKP